MTPIRFSLFPISRSVQMLACLAATNICTTLWSQEDTVDEETVYELTAFEVVADEGHGYLATNSTAGTSLNLAIRDIPMQLEVINTQFIEDQAATDQREALMYSAGVFMSTFENATSAVARSNETSPSSSVNVGSEFNNSISIRGYSVPNSQRFGFRVGANVPAYGVVLGGSTDTINTGRQEVVRGPQSLLYGISVLSGIVNNVPKTPLDEKRTSLSMLMGSDNLFRVGLDTTGPLIKDRLNYRLAYSHNEVEDWTDYKKSDKNYLTGQLGIQLSRSARLLLEGTYSRTKTSGYGAKLFQDSPNGEILNKFRNKWDEAYTFGRDYFDEEIIDLPQFEGESDPYGPLYGRKWLLRQDDHLYDFPDLGYDYRISGPDTFREQKEYGALVIGNFKLTKKLDLEVGGYYTKTDIFERNVTIDVTDSRGAFIPSFNGNRGWKFNPEVAAYLDENGNPINGDFTIPDKNNPGDDWDKGWGPGELWIGQDDDADKTGNPMTEFQRRYAWYSWWEKPTDSESLQMRMKLAYSVETHGLRGWLNAKHTFVGGLNYIKDQVSFVNGGVNPDNAYSAGEDFPDTGSTYENSNKLDRDPFYIRESLFDYTPIRFTEDTVVAIPGNIRTGNLGDLSDGSLRHYVSRSGWKDVDLWYKSQYGVYHGEWWNGRLNLIGGIRRDVYQVLEAERLRVMDPYMESDHWQGGKYRVTPFFAGYGNTAPAYFDDLPEEMNAKIAEEIQIISDSTDRGTIEHNFEEDQVYVTPTFGLSYRIHEDFSIYCSYSEGIFPNTGQRDGEDNAIEAEQTTSNEIGFKFDLFDGKISGTIAGFRIERENATYFWEDAPAPAKWNAGPAATKSDIPLDEWHIGFDPYAIEAGLTTIRLGVREEYVVDAFEKAGVELPMFRGQYDRSALRKYGLNAIGTAPSSDPTKGFPDTFFYMRIEDMLNYDGVNPFIDAFDTAIRDKEAYDPINWWYGASGTTELSYSASAPGQSGASVRFEEEGLGIDGHIIFSPIDNYQIRFGFSQQKREVVGGGFILSPGYGLDVDGEPISDQLFTTQYDRWVWILGPENFEDPANPATLKSGAIKGIDLSFVPKWSYNIWNRYEFIDGPLEGLSIGAGLRVYGPVATSVPIGGAELSINEFLTPDRPEKYHYDAMLAYRVKFWGVAWRFQLNIYDMFAKDRVEIIEKEFPLDDGTSEFRRTLIFNNQTRFRLSVTANF